MYHVIVYNKRINGIGRNNKNKINGYGHIGINTRVG